MILKLWVFINWISCEQIEFDGRKMEIEHIGLLLMYDSSFSIVFNSAASAVLM